MDGELRDDQVVELLDLARADDAARSRARRRWLRRQAEESATLLGTLVDLAEQPTTVVVATAGGRRWTGAVLGVVDDALVLRIAGGRLVVAASALAWVRAPGGGRPAAGTRRPTPGTTMLDLLDDAAEDRSAVVLHPTAGEAVRGRLVAVGADVLSVRPDGGGVLYVAAASVSEVVLASG